MWNKAKIMRTAERTLKRTESYLENRSDSSDPEDNFQLDYVLAKGSKSTPDTAIAYAHYEDKVISFNPFVRDGDAKTIWDWGFNIDDDLFCYLEQGYDLVGMLPEAHNAIWGEITEYHHDGSCSHPKGMQQYLNYCKRNGVTAELLRKKFQYNGIDVMKLYDKSAVRKKPSQEKER